jgi:hypothetical protein
LRPRRVLEMARRGEIPAYPLGQGKRRAWRFRLFRTGFRPLFTRCRLCSRSRPCQGEHLMARKRNQHGSIRVLSRKSGDVFEYRYYKTRADGERVRQTSSWER